MQIVDFVALRPVDTYVMQIRAAYARSVESIIAIGRELIEAKSNLRHGEFERMCRTRLPFKERSAQMYMKIARHSKLSNPQMWGRLPASIATLDFLAGLDDELLELALGGEGIRPDQSEAEIRLCIDQLSSRLRASAQPTTPAVPARTGTLLVMPARTAGASDSIKCTADERHRLFDARTTATACMTASHTAASEPSVSVARRADDLRALVIDAMALIERQVQTKVVDEEHSLQLLARWQGFNAPAR